MARGLSVEKVTVPPRSSSRTSRGSPRCRWRRSPRRLGFTTMSLYRHVSGKDELVRRMLDVALGLAPEFEIPDWRTGLETLGARDARAALSPPVGHRRPDHRDARHRRAALMAQPRPRVPRRHRASTRTARRSCCCWSTATCSGPRAWRSRCREDLQAPMIPEELDLERVPGAQARGRRRRLRRRDTGRGPLRLRPAAGARRRGLSHLDPSGTRRAVSRRLTRVGRVVVVGSINADLVVVTERLPAAGETDDRRHLRPARRRQGRQPGRRRGAPRRRRRDGRRRRRRRPRRRGAARAARRGHRHHPDRGRRGADRRRADRRRPARREPDRGRVRRERDDVPRRRLDLARRGRDAARPRGLRPRWSSARAAPPREAGWPVVLNPAPARALPDVPIAVLTPNRTEAAELSGEDDPEAAARALAEQTGAAVLITLGGDGALLLEPGGEPVRLPATKVDVVDTTGAGDTVNGALAAELANGASLRGRGGVRAARGGDLDDEAGRARRNAAPRRGGRVTRAGAPARAAPPRGPRRTPARRTPSRAGRRLRAARAGGRVATLAPPALAAPARGSRLRRVDRAAAARGQRDGARAAAVARRTRAGCASRRCRTCTPGCRTSGLATIRRVVETMNALEPDVHLLLGDYLDASQVLQRPLAPEAIAARARAPRGAARHGGRDRQPRLAQVRRPDVAGARRAGHHGARGPRDQPRASSGSPAWPTCATGARTSTARCRRSPTTRR